MFPKNKTKQKNPTKIQRTKKDTTLMKRDFFLSIGTNLHIYTNMFYVPNG